MDSKRIEKAVEVINFAIKNQLSVKAASVACGFSDTYVKNVKAVVIDLFANDALSEEDYNKFMNAYKKYKQGEMWNFDTSYSKPDDIPSTKKGEQIIFDQKGDEANLTITTDDNTFLGEEAIEILENTCEGDESYPKNHITTLDQLLEYCDVDTDEWKVAEYRVNKWDTTSWSDGFARTIQNFQVKARLIRNVTVAKEKTVGEIFRDMVRTYKAPILNSQPLLPGLNKENNLFEVSIFDLHIGKLAWMGETGENYDTKIARSRFLKTIETLIQRASGFQYSRILFPVGNDFFNSDTIFNTTTKGTPQDEDLRWQKTFQVGVKLLVDAINMLKQTGVPVDVMVIPGNHDFERSYYMGAYLEAWFNEDKQVNINNGASPRKYYKFGKVLLGLTHGGEEKESSLPLLMATDIESKPMWSDTVYHEWHLGHVHRKKNINYMVLDKTRTVSEDLGVTVRYLSSLTGTEEWHHKKGFVGAIKAGEGFIWNDEAGLMAHLNSNLIID